MQIDHERSNSQWDVCQSLIYISKAQSNDIIGIKPCRPVTKLQNTVHITVKYTQQRRNALDSFLFTKHGVYNFYLSLCTNLQYYN